MLSNTIFASNPVSFLCLSFVLPPSFSLYVSRILAYLHVYSHWDANQFQEVFSDEKVTAGLSVFEITQENVEKSFKQFNSTDLQRMFMFNSKPDEAFIMY